MPAIKKIITSFIMLSAEVIFQLKLTLSANDDKKMQIPGGWCGGLQLQQEDVSLAIGKVSKTWKVDFVFHVKYLEGLNLPPQLMRWVAQHIVKIIMAKTEMTLTLNFAKIAPIVSVDKYHQKLTDSMNSKSYSSGWHRNRKSSGKCFHFKFCFRWQSTKINQRTIDFYCKDVICRYLWMFLFHSS